jgi:dihydrofolate reductase
MRPLIVTEFLSLDGVMEGFGCDPAALADAVRDRTTTAYLLGRRTYEEMAAFWPQQRVGDELADYMNGAQKYVVSRTLSWPRWTNTQVLAGDVAAGVNSLKSRGVGNLVVLGSGALVQQLAALDLVDGYRLFLHPVLLGAGRRLFRDSAPAAGLRLTDCQAVAGGVLLLNYARLR